MDNTKGRLFAGGAAVLFGLAGVACLGIAVVVGLAAVMGLGAASVVAGCVFLAIGACCAAVFLIPAKAMKEEVSDIEETAAGALADLPFDTLRALIEKRPLTTALGAGFVAYMIIREPRETVRTAQRLLPFIIAR